MHVSYEKALAIFDSIPSQYKSAYLHPFYVSADASRDPALKPVFWVYEEDGAIFYHGFHLAKIENTQYYDIQSPYGYGGAISSSSDTNFLSRAWASYSNWCKENFVLAEFIRFHPLLQNWQFYNGEVIYNRDTVFVDLSSHDLMSNYNPRTRTAIRKALKNEMTFEWIKSDQAFYIFPKLYNSAMTLLGAESSYFFSDTYHQLILGWEKVNLAVCRLSDGNIGAAAVFFESNKMIEYHLGASTKTGQTLGAMLMLMYTVSLYAQKLGYEFLYLGGGTTSEAQDSLLFFKSRLSKLSASFRIGKSVFYPDMYDTIKYNWQLKNGCVPNRILFYR